MTSKKWYASKTIWINLAALTAIAIQAFIGENAMDPALQSSLLAVANAALRLFTAQPVG